MGSGASNNYRSYGRGGPPNRQAIGTALSGKGGGYAPNQPLPSNVKGGGDGYPRPAVLPDDYVAPLRPPKSFKDPNYGDPRDRGYPLPRRFERPSAPTPMPPPAPTPPIQARRKYSGPTPMPLPGQEPMNTYRSGKGGAGMGEPQRGDPLYGMDTGGRRYKGDIGGRIDNRFNPEPVDPVIPESEGARKLRGFASRFQSQPDPIQNQRFNTRNPLTDIDSRMDRTKRTIQSMEDRGLPIPARLQRRVRQLQARQAMEQRRLQRMMELRNRASQPMGRGAFTDPRLRQAIGRSAFMDPRFR